MCLQRCFVFEVMSARRSLQRPGGPLSVAAQFFWADGTCVEIEAKAPSPSEAVGTGEHPLYVESRGSLQLLALLEHHVTLRDLSWVPNR